MGRFGFVAGLLAAALAACTTDAPQQAPVRQVVSTTSFGMCVGYCSTRLELSEAGAVLTRSARGGRGGGANLPDQRFTAALTASEWTEIAQLARNSNLSGLPDTIGCPDCADGGAESLTIAGATERTITFEHGARIEEAQPLLERVRALRTRLTPAE